MLWFSILYYTIIEFKVLQTRDTVARQHMGIWGQYILCFGKFEGNKFCASVTMSLFDPRKVTYPVS